MQIDSVAWSGEGTFTQMVLDRLRSIEHVVAMKIEDAPATRSDADYNFIANEIFVTLATSVRVEPTRRFGIIPGSKRVLERAMTFEALTGILSESADVGPPDYADETMMQYLRTERIIPPYQTRGYKLVELVRIYEAGTARRT